MVSLASLVAHQDRYDGNRVRVEGHVRLFVDADGGEYFVLEDTHHDRVQLEPAASASSYRRAVVRVTGCFTADPTTGRHLRITTIARLVEGVARRPRALPTHACRRAGGPTA